MRKLFAFRRYPRSVRFLIVPAVVLMGLASLALRLMPMRRLAPLLGHRIGAVALVPLPSPAQARKARRLQQTIALAARRLPFRSDCFPQALVAIAFCRAFRIPAALHFGVRREDSSVPPLSAHAWVVSGPVAICGANASFANYTVVGCFVSPAALVT